MLRNKIKAFVALSILSGVVLVQRQQVNGMMRKVVTGAAGATTSASRSTLSRSGATGINNKGLAKKVTGPFTEKLSSYSSYKSHKQGINHQKQMLEASLASFEQEGVSGIFKTSSGGKIRLKISSKETDDSMPIKFIKIKTGDEFNVVSADGEHFYPTLSIEELVKFDDDYPGYLRKGIDPLGRDRVIIVIEGESGKLAYDLLNGIFRDVYEDEKFENIYLGKYIDINKLSDPIKDNAKDLILNTSMYSSVLDIDQKAVERLSKQKQISSDNIIKLPILTARQISDYENENPGLVQKVFDKNGNKQPVLILDGDGGERVAYNLSDGKFSKVQLSKKKNLTLTEGVKKEDVSSNDIERLKSMLPRDAVQSAEQGAIGGGISVPKLSLQQINDIKSEEEHSNLITLLKDVDGKDLDVIVVNASGEKVAYNLKEGTVGNIVTGKKGKEMVKGQVDPNTLSAPLKDGLEDLFSKLNIGYTKTGDSTTVGSRIVGGARRKTKLKLLKPEGDSSSKDLTPIGSREVEASSFKAQVLTKSGDIINENIHTKLTGDGVEYNYVILSDGSEQKVTLGKGEKYIPVLSEQNMMDFNNSQPGYLMYAVDGVGDNQPIVIFQLSNGDNIAYQVLDGIFRNVIKENGIYKLKNKVDVRNLPVVDRHKILGVVVYTSAYVQ